VAGQYEGQLFVVEGAVVVGETDPAVELGVAGQALVDAGCDAGSGR
jgi:hypothetical protein